VFLDERVATAPTTRPDAEGTSMRRFYGAHARGPHEHPDEDAIITGIVLDFKSVEFTNGSVVVTWCRLSPPRPLWELYSSSASFHEGRDRCVDRIVTYWLDPEPQSPPEPLSGT
jgi:hypothetical protein